MHPIVYHDALIAVHTFDLEQGQELIEQLPGKVAEGTGLGYWIGGPERGYDYRIYALTHLPSGCSFPIGFLHDEQVVQEIIAHMAPLIDWNRPLDELRTDPTYDEANSRFSAIVFEALVSWSTRQMPVTPTQRQIEMAWLN